MSKKKIIFAAGGSGGHLFPAMAAAKKLEELNIEPVFIGVGLDKTPFFEREAFTYFSIQGSSISRKNFYKAPFLILAGFFKSLLLIYHLKSSLIIGFGSYHSFPIQIAAFLFKIPMCLFEPNLELGKVNSIFYPFCKKCLSYFSLNLSKSEQIAPLKPLQKIDKVQACQTLNLQTNKPIFLIMGGSQGSIVLNAAILKIDPLVLRDFFIIHLAGSHDQATVLKNHYSTHFIDHFVLPFSDKMQEILSVADFMLARSGASALLEAIHYEIPTLFVPYGFDEKGHQYANAKYFVDELKGGMLLRQKDLNQAHIEKSFSIFLSQRSQFRQNLKEVSQTQPKEEFSNLILNMIQ